MPPTSQQKRTELAELLLRIRRKLFHLTANKKQAISSFDVDIRKLKHLEASLLVKDADTQQLSLFTTESVMSPDLENLLGPE